VDKQKFYNEALQVAKDLNTPKIVVNEIGEFFTNRNLALLSVNGNKEKIDEFDFTEKLAEGAGAASAKNDKAKNAVLGKIEKAKNADAAQALLVGYEEDADVKAAVEAKVKSFDVKYTLTADDITNIPELAKANLKEGDEVGFEPSKVDKKQLVQLLGQ